VEKKMFCGGESFLQGVFAFYGVLVMVNRGEVVVNCVVNRGAWTTLFCRPKACQLFEIFFLTRSDLARGFDESHASSAL
jgi:hypothetical protein